jgi:hypothetical protein
MDTGDGPEALAIDAVPNTETKRNATVRNVVRVLIFEEYRWFR